MIDSGSAPKHEIRSQVAFIGKLVAALEADYSSAKQNNQELVAINEKVVSENAQLVQNNSAIRNDALDQQKAEFQKAMKDATLKRE